MTEISHNMNHLQHLEAVAAADVAFVRMREETYRGSWKKRGGVGAFMMLARKWDRLETMMELPGVRYDIFSCMEIEQRIQGEDGTSLAEVRDLRRYLLLVEAEMVARGVVTLGDVGLARSVVRSLLDHTHEPDYIPVPRAPGFDNSEGPNIQDVLPKPPPHTDSNRHAAQEYLMDGETSWDYDRRDIPWILVPGTQGMQGLVDRKRLPPGQYQNLPLLAVELNAKEHEETLPEYRWLYEWSDGKFRMREAYREMWGKP